MRLETRLLARGAAAAVFVTAVGVHAGPPGVPALTASPVRQRVPRGGGTAEFLIERPEGATSRGWLLSGGGSEPVAGFTLSSRVLVRGEAGAASARRAGLTVRPAVVGGFGVVETASVAEAAAVARGLRAAGISAEVDAEAPRVLRSLPADPFFQDQWHLRNTLLPIADVNAEAAWALGYTGAGVTIGVLEGGFQTSHPDLAGKVFAEASTSLAGSTSHATSVAGVAAATSGNGLGGVGLAHGAALSNLVFGLASQTAAAFSHRNDLNDIKNNSWGPPDTGVLWDTIAAEIELAAIEEAATNGRGGLGTVLVWAAGNGGEFDRTDYDPYVSSRFTLGVGAIGDGDVRASYNERGSSMLVVAHSSGNSRGIVTTSGGGGFTGSFGGTSAAAPLASGAIALALEANPSLSWRDVRALLIETARPVDTAGGGYVANGAGYEVSYDYGFGAIDAGALVLAAETWEPLPPEIELAPPPITPGQTIPDAIVAGVTFPIEVTEEIVVETAEIELNIVHPRVGNLEIVLASPSGTESVLAERRFDSSADVTHTFVTHRVFGESSAGVWTLRVADRQAGNVGQVVRAALRVHGYSPFAPCSAADLTEDGVLDFADVSAFVAAFGAGQTAADIDGRAGIGFGDVQVFITLFNLGCP